jgi:hypothetical protein
MQNDLMFPVEYLRLIEQNILDVAPWAILQKDEIYARMNGVKSRYPGRCLIPFAIRIDNDDIACWEDDDRSKVYVIHDFASPGWENAAVYNSFWEWFQSAVADMIAYDR